MDILAICVIGILTFGTYKLFELFVRRKERMFMIEKLDHLNGGVKFNGDKIDFPAFSSYGKFISLRIASLLMGVGLGFLVGVLIRIQPQVHELWRDHEIIYFACVSFFGGLGLLISYLIEINSKQK